MKFDVHSCLGLVCQFILASKKGSAKKTETPHADNADVGIQI